MYPDFENTENGVLPNTPIGGTDDLPAMDDAECDLSAQSQYSQTNSTPVYAEANYTTPQYDAPSYSDTPPSNDIPSYSDAPPYGDAPSSDDIPSYSDASPYNASAYGEIAYNTPAYSGEAHAEPTYIQADQATPISTSPQEAPWGMYSPNVFTNQPYQRENLALAVPTLPPIASKEPKVRKKRLGRFFRAACLVILCSFFSAVAAFSVIEYRILRGDFIVNNQVFLGNTVPPSRPEATLVPEQMTTMGDEMTAEAIYEMALTQVVGISIPSMGLGGAIESEFDAPSMPATGSGFIISSDGYILTNYHVIEFASFHDLPVNVTMFNGPTYDAQIIGFDPDNDVALLKIDATDLNPVLIGSHGDLRVGQRVYAVGNPFGDLLYTMTDGIVSALDRVVTVEGRSINFFQTSAAVNRGNSGGPVYNTRGEVIGVVTAKVIRGDAEGIGFAIPINDAIEIATELIEHGYLAGRPLIGITGQTVTSGQADYFDWVVGTYIRSIVEDSAAEVAGLRVGDIITAIGDVDTDTMDDLRAVLRTYSAGDTTTITVWRQIAEDVAHDGEYITFPITFDEDMNAGVPRQQRP